MNTELLVRPTMPGDVKAQLFAVLTALPLEVDALKKAIINETFDGTVYSNANGACLVGTVCKTNIKKIQRLMCSGEGDHTILVTTPSGQFPVDANTELESYVMPIHDRRGMEGDERRALLLEAIVEWEVKHKVRALKVWNAAKTHRLGFSIAD